MKQESVVVYPGATVEHKRSDGRRFLYGGLKTETEIRSDGTVSVPGQVYGLPLERTVIHSMGIYNDSDTTSQQNVMKDTLPPLKA